MDIENLGLDFDGVLRKFPSFISWYINHLSPNDILIRSKLFRLRKLLTYLLINKTPMILDNKLIESIKVEKPKRLIIVSGRCQEKEKVRRKLSPFLKVDKFYFREDCTEPEERFKERILKIENVNLFIEDRAYIVRYLRKKGIETYHISEVRRTR